MTIKVLLDTDIGSDIDDAVCLAYLLAQPACDLLGITTVTGESAARAKLASALCLAAGRADIPIYPGEETPLVVAQRQAIAHQASALGRWPHAADFPRGAAVDFLRRTIRAHPGEVVLLTIGPLTNIARLLEADPEILALLRDLVIMGGNFAAPYSFDTEDWNTLCDPQAAARVFDPAHRLRAVGIDITTQVRMPADEVRRRFTAPLLRPVRDFAEVWFEGSADLTYHDPLAGMTIFEPDVCAFRRGVARVEFEEATGKVRTPWVESAGGPHEVATAVDVPAFFERFFTVF